LGFGHYDLVSQGSAPIIPQPGMVDKWGLEANCAIIEIPILA